MGMRLPFQEGEGKWKGDMMLDLVSVEMWYVEMRQDELRQLAAASRTARIGEGHRPHRRQRWLLRLAEFLAGWGLRIPALPTTGAKRAVVRVARHKHGGSHVWQHR